MSKIVSFGDSFIFGSEIPENYDGSAGWPGISAKYLDIDFECCAMPGTSNDAIAREIFSYYQKNSTNHLAVVNWTWILRWDYFLKEEYLWETLGVGKFTLYNAVEQRDYKNLTTFYHDLIIDNQMFNKWNNLKTIFSVIKFLTDNNIPFVQTYMDHELIEKEWFNESYTDYMITICKQNLNTFGNKNFLDWSHEKGFKITDPGWHPLEDAHEAAAKYWLPTYKKLLGI